MTINEFNLNPVLRRRLDEVIASMNEDDLKLAMESVKAALWEKKRGQIEALRNELRLLSDAQRVSPEELLLIASDPVGASSSSKAVFANPDNPGQTWAGRGRRPQWLREKLEQGCSLKEFRVA